MSDLEGLEQVAAQTSIPFNHRTSNGRGGFAWSIGPNIERVFVQRPKAEVLPTVPKPITSAPVASDAAALDLAITTYSELITAIDARRRAKQVRQLDFDELAGWALGLSGKVFAPIPTKKIGLEKCFDALRAVGLRIRIEVDPEQDRKMNERIAEKFLPMNVGQARFGNTSRRAGMKKSRRKQARRSAR